MKVLYSALLMSFVALASNEARADSCPLTFSTWPFTLQNGQTADANQVMANFNATINCVRSGSWVPALTFSGGGSATLSTATGTYFQFGKQVMVEGNIGISALNSPSGTVMITNLPVQSAPAFIGTASIPHYSGFSVTGVAGGLVPASSTAIFLTQTGGSNQIYLLPSNISSTSNFYFTATYLTN